MNKPFHTEKVAVRPLGAGIHVELARPGAINSLDMDMIRGLDTVFRQAGEDPDCAFVLVTGAGKRGFCAGGDIKALYGYVTDGDFEAADRLFAEEYAMDLLIHRLDKPVVVLAHGITMGGGLGLAAGADLVLCDESTTMAMPETRIGFFPDVGATGWLHERCLPGYPEYLALCGCEQQGAECARIGLATHQARNLRATAGILETFAPMDREPRREAAARIAALLAPLLRDVFTTREQAKRDAWVEKMFHGRTLLERTIDDLANEGTASGREALSRVGARSPTAQALALALLHANRGRPMERVFEAERTAARFMVRHHDYAEGVRAQIIDKDHSPRWKPARPGDVVLPEDLLRELARP
ncbi:MAG: enoyl-CoA hydratase/isomerase family protein [Desulfatibacillaceae bacterium]